ncbi:HK97-gp10 family putative phage morphogenesis protein [Lysobacter enzymogenes]|uniref:HK97-gp10 family putative phage morphogenesis protein n=1 Tax=Lysobacter enzymogenes TaxID=69 RepID=UPI000898F084|nr:HK97-gp10 family putative phage morphogenesis protein [Lysobacter enzymogenes]SDW94972.1 phage protein, HK97 gp10 family [Lysobacter enzymogenes]
MKVDTKLTGMDGVLRTLQALPAEIVSKRGGPVKLALAKGARKLRDQARQNLRQSIAEGGARTTGMTEKSVIASRGKAINGGNGERYLVRVKKGTFTNADGFPTSTLMTANLLEYGSSHQPPTPWLRPAVQQVGGQVIEVVTEDLLRRIDKTVTQLAAQNRSGR